METTQNATSNVATEIDKLLTSLPTVDDEAIASKRRVFIASDIVSKRNERVTQKAVRALLGGGSFGPIGDHIKIWKDEKKEEIELGDAPIPYSLNEKLVLMNASVWQAAQDEADKKLVIERESLEKAQKRAVMAVEDLQENINVLESEASLQVVLATEKDELIVDLEAANEKLDNNLSNAARQIIELNNQVDDKEKTEAELIELKTNHEELKSNNNELKGLHAGLESQHNDTLSANKELEKSLLTVHSGSDKIKSELTAVEKEKTATSAINKELEGKNKSLEKDKNSLDLQVQKLQISLDSLTKYNDKNEKKLSDARKTVSDREREAGKLTGILDTIKDQNSKLEDRVSELEKMLAKKNS